MKKMHTIRDALEEMKNTERGFTTEGAKNDARWYLLAYVLREMCEAQGIDIDCDSEEEVK